MKTALTPAPPKPTRASTARIQEQIRRRAHELYAQRGGQAGYDLQDWLQAKSELTQQSGMNS